MLGDKMKATGILELIFTNMITGKIRKYIEHNLIVTVGKNHIADQMADQGEAQISHMAIGTGTTAAVVGDTTLETELDRNALTSVTQGTGGSENEVTYLGDWHSHPSSTSSLSLLDKRTLTKIATTDEANCKNPIMLILGKKPEKWSANVVKFLSGKLFVWPFVSCNYEPLDIKVYND